MKKYILPLDKSYFENENNLQNLADKLDHFRHIHDFADISAIGNSYRHISLESERFTYELTLQASTKDRNKLCAEVNKILKKGKRKVQDIQFDKVKKELVFIVF